MHVPLPQDYDGELSAELERTLLYDERGRFNEALLARPPDAPPDAGLYRRPDPDAPFRPVGPRPSWACMHGALSWGISCH